MLIEILVFEQEGESNGVLAIMPAVAYNKKDKHKRDKEKILEILRYDREKEVYGAYGLDKNPSRDISTIEFYYSPFMEKQKKFQTLPYQITDTIQVIDVFTCIGSRFGLKPLSVIVEVCESNCGNNPIWANVYYIANSETPAIIIRVAKHVMFVKEEHLP